MAVVQRGTGVTLVERFYDVDPLTEDAVPANPTVVLFTLQAPDETETTYELGVDGEVTNPEVGVFLCALPPPLPSGTYLWTCEGSGGGIDAASSDSFTILENGVLAPTAPGAAEYGPCSAWIGADDVADCCSGTTLGSDLWKLEEAAALGSHLMYELTGRQFPGICHRTVRPCRSGCACFSTASSGWAWGGGSWSDDCGRSCGCGVESFVRLPGYPVREVLEVKIDGVAVDPSGYRLDGRRDLFRLADVGPPVVRQAWPACQRLDLPDTEEGTFSILYAWGMPPPELAKRAAAQLGCELFKACGGASGDCRLPGKVTKVVRQGVTFEKIPSLASMLRKGATGLQLVDAVIGQTNPSGMRRRPAVVQLDRPTYPRVLGE